MLKPIFAALVFLALSTPQVCQAQFTGELTVVSRTGDFMRIDIESGNRQILTEAAQRGWERVSGWDAYNWSPDATKIVASIAGGIPTSDFNTRRYDIFVMDPDFTNLVNLTNDQHLDQAPAFSPDGSKIAFTSRPAIRAGTINPNTSFSDIYVIDADGNNRIRLTELNADFNNSTPSWSPDGSKITFASNRLDGNYEIFVMDADGSNPIRLTNSSEGEYWPTFSPDGSKILFFQEQCPLGCDGPSDIMVMNADGSNLMRLTDADGENTQNVVPNWSPDGSAIAWTRITLNDGLILTSLMNADGSNATHLPGSMEAMPVWTPVPGAVVLPTLIRARSWGQIKEHSR